MEFPEVLVRGDCQQFSEVSYGRLLGVMSKGGKLLYKQDGRSRFAVFNTFPLPLTPPNDRTPYDLTKLELPEENLPPGLKYNVFKQILYFYSNHTDVRLPVPVATSLLLPTGPTCPKDPNFSKWSRQPIPSHPTAADSAKPTDHIPCCSSVAHYGNLLLWAFGPDLTTLTVACLTPPSDPTLKKDSFVNWAQHQSPLPYTLLQALTMPGQIRDIQVTKINSKGYVCVRSDYYLCMFLVVGEQLESVLVHQTKGIIKLSALSPYVAKECLVLTEPGGLFLVSKGSKVTIAIPTPTLPQALCFGPHPLSAVVAIGNTVYRIDFRRSPTSTHVLFESKQRVTCLSHDPSISFIVYMGTPTQLLLADWREPGRATLAIQVNLLQPPTFITSTSKDDESFLLLTNWTECMLVGVSRDPPHRSTLRPHLVNNLKVVHSPLMTVELPSEGQLCHVIYRLMRPIIGATLWCNGDTFTAITITDFGDVFHQSWSYQGTPASRADYHATLTPSVCHGYNLWIDKAHAQEKELARYKEMHPSGTRKSIKGRPHTYLIDYMISPEAPSTRLCVRCHFTLKTCAPDIDPSNHISPKATTDTHCTFCGSVFAPPPKNKPSMPVTRGKRRSAKVKRVMRSLRTMRGPRPWGRPRKPRVKCTAIMSVDNAMETLRKVGFRSGKSKLDRALMAGWKD